MALDDLDPDALYHLASSAEWADYQARGVIDPASIEAEGFVHCSYGRQVAGTVGKHFADATDLLALQLDAGALGDVELKDEDSYNSGQTFPHAYGAIPTAAVTGTTTVIG